MKRRKKKLFIKTKNLTESALNRRKPPVPPSKTILDEKTKQKNSKYKSGDLGDLGFT